MEKIERMVATCMQDQDFDREYLMQNFWLIINSDGNVDNLEREYYEQLCCYLKNAKRRLN